MGRCPRSSNSQCSQCLARVHPQSCLRRRESALMALLKQSTLYCGGNSLLCLSGANGAWKIYKYVSSRLHSFSLPFSWLSSVKRLLYDNVAYNESRNGEESVERSTAI